MFEIVLEGAVGWDFDPADVRNQLAKADGGDVLVKVNSPGGYAMDGVAIHSEFLEYSGNVTVRVQGLAASSASLLIMAADLVEMAPGSMLMLHDPALDGVEYRGTAEEHTRLATELEKLRATYGEVYAARSGQNLKAVLKWMGAETWFSPSDAVEAGLADLIFENTTEAEPFPANYAAAFRNAPVHLVQLAHAKGWDRKSKGNSMTVKNKPVKAERSQGPKSLAPITSRAPGDDLIAEERKRVSGLMALANREGNASLVAQDRLAGWIDEGVTVAQAREWVLDAKADAENDGGDIRNNGGHIQSLGRNAVGQSYDHGDGLVEKLADGLMARVKKSHEPTMGREFAGATMVDLAGVVLQAHGRKTPLFGGKAAKVEMAMTTSEFPRILGNVMNRSMLDHYETATSGIKMLGREVEASDFRALHAARLSIGPDLEEVREGAEYKYGTIEEGSETYAVKTYGKILGLTRQTMINDDLGAFDNMARTLGEGAAQTEGKLLAALLAANSGAGPTMDDGKAMFHDDHNNLASSGAAPSISTISSARTAMQRQRGMNGEIIRATPRYVLVPPEMQTSAEQSLAVIAAADEAKANPFSGNLEPILDSFLEDSSAWYLAAAPGSPDTLQYAYLNGQSGPEVFEQEGFEMDVMQFKCRLDFGAGFVDHRGWYRNPGQ
ncbi:Clp protease ClpP [Rhodobacteraceae bacterium F11138]|nr:Clp protease ClpP [Rhodobacteraceae bacterium F11138]